MLWAEKNNEKTSIRFSLRSPTEASHRLPISPSGTPNFHVAQLSSKLSPTMGKRKFDHVDGSDPGHVSASKRQRSSQQDDLEGILDNGKKAMYRALRVSKGFERQKLGRRQKTAKEQNESEELVRLAEEVTALKVSDSTTSHS